MPSDNLENLFREKVEEVQHTPPPQFTWGPEKSWEKLQLMLPAQRPKTKLSFYLSIAAGLVLLLVAGLSVFRLAETKAPEVAVVSPVGKPLARSTEKPLKKRVIIPKKPTTEIAAAKPESETAPSQREVNLSFEIAAPTELPTPEKETMIAAVGPENKIGTGDQIALSRLPAPEENTQPIKITVVLGAKTLARAEALALDSGPALNTKLAAQEKTKKKKLRLRIQNPENGLQAETQLATHTPSSYDGGVITRIKF